MPFTVVGNLDGDTLTIAVSGELDLATVPLVYQALKTYVGLYRLVTYEAADVTFIDCTGLKSLLSAADGDPSSERIVFRDPSRALARLLQLLQMEGLVGRGRPPRAIAPL